MTTHYWLLKSEPQAYSIQDLENKANQTDAWDGIRNYTVRNLICHEIKVGHLAFFYHSSCKETGIVGIVEVVKNAYPDKTALDPNHKSFDPRATIQKPIWSTFDVKLIRTFKRTILLKQLKSCEALWDMALLKKGNRFSIQALSEAHWTYILKLE